MKSKRPLRAPFVVTVTAVALSSLGCAAATGTSDCPSSPPANGSPCGAASRSCSYDSCASSLGVGYASCNEGVWSVGRASCNPAPPDIQYPDATDVQPPPDAPAVCPTMAPANGDPCSTSDTPCYYGDCFGTPDTQARCTGGSWQILRSTCNPPAPDVQPGPDATDVSTPPPDAPLVCPPTVPMLGEACTANGATCFYGDCFGTPDTHASCVDGSWQVLRASCNPPFDAGSPPPDASGGGG